VPENKNNVFDEIQEYTGDYIKLLLEAVKEGLYIAADAKNCGKYIGTYHDYPTLSHRESGLPNLSSSYGGGPIDYRNIYHSYGGDSIAKENEIYSFVKLIEFVRSCPSLHYRFNLEIDTPPGGVDIKVDETFITSGIKDSIERYIHEFGTFEYDENKAIEAILPAIKYIFDKTLNIEIHVPILFIRFGFDEFELSKGVFIKRIEDNDHLARTRVKSYNTSAHELVTSSATHAFVLKGWSVPNNERMWNFNTLYELRAYPLDIINQFFGAFRISTDVDTGYSQVYSKSIGWGSSYTAKWPCLQGATIRAYPNWFEDYHWNEKEIPMISSSMVASIKDAYYSISNATENSIDLSIKRLNRCLVRDNEEDSVLDATIALEALLSDDGNQEMTHKLAMRVGALSKLDKNTNKTPGQAFKDIKSIYSYRSAIVHGSKSLDKKRVIKIDDENEITAHNLSVEYLKMVLRVLLENKKYRVPKVIDIELLLGP